MAECRTDTSSERSRQALLHSQLKMLVRLLLACQLRLARTLTFGSESASHSLYLSDGADTGWDGQTYTLLQSKLGVNGSAASRACASQADLVGRVVVAPWHSSSSLSLIAPLLTSLLTARILCTSLNLCPANPRAASGKDQYRNLLHPCTVWPLSLVAECRPPTTVEGGGRRFEPVSGRLYFWKPRGVPSPPKLRFLPLYRKMLP